MSRALSVKTSVFLRRTCYEQKYFVAKIKVAMEAPGGILGVPPGSLPEFRFGLYTFWEDRFSG